MVVEEIARYGETGRRGRRGRNRYVLRPLTEALSHARTDLTLLQGAPGSGKSVALRMHARAELERIRHDDDADRPIPLYVNLRDLPHGPDEIDAPALLSYIEGQVNPQRSPELTAYFAENFGADLRDGHVLLLLDSFDEIPAILGSATVDPAVRPYVSALVDLVGGGGARCVVAAREYKGPAAADWSRLQLLPLSTDEQVAFLRAYGLDGARLERVRPLLTEPRRGFASHLCHPLSLALLASFVSREDTVPERPSSLYAQFVAQRLDASLAVAANPSGRAVVEDFLAGFAFRLTRTGLSLPWDEYARLLESVPAPLREVPVASGLLVRSPEPDTGERVSFGHRRVQEYFVTRYVAVHPDALDPADLASDGRWRETAVTLLQVGAGTTVAALLAELTRVLREAGEATGDPREFQWTPAAVHCLEILTAAYSGRQNPLEGDLREVVDALIAAAWEKGSVSDRKFCLDCLPLLTEPDRERYIDQAFGGPSNWIRITALRDCALLPSISAQIHGSIRRLLITLLGEKTLSADGRAIDTDLHRLRHHDDFVRLRRLLSTLPLTLLAICTVGLASRWAHISEVRDLSVLDVPYGLAYAYLLPFMFFWTLLSSQPLSYGTGKSSLRKVLERTGKVIGINAEENTRTEILLSAYCLTAFLAAASYLVESAWEVVHGAYASALLVLARLLVIVYSWLWAGSLLYIVGRHENATRLSFRQRVFSFWEAMRIADHPVRSVRVLDVFGFLLSLVPYIAIVGTTYGLFWLLERFGGRIGHQVFVAVPFAGTALVLAVLLGGALREYRRHHRVRHAAARVRRNEPDSFLHNMLRLRDPEDAASFVQRVRLRRDLDVLAIDRSVVRTLVAILEFSATRRVSLLFPLPVIETTDPYIARLAGLVAAASPALRAAVGEHPRTFRAWSSHSALVDELARLDEQLRER